MTKRYLERSQTPVKLVRNSGAMGVVELESSERTLIFNIRDENEIKLREATLKITRTQAIQLARDLLTRADNMDPDT